MTRSVLLEALARRFPQLHAKDTETAIKIVLDAIAETLGINS